MNNILKILLITLIPIISLAQEIRLKEDNITVWSRDQIIEGELVNFTADSGSLFFNGMYTDFEIINESEFSIPVKLAEGENIIFVEVPNADSSIYSDSLKLKLGYDVRPEIFAYAEVVNSDVTLHGRILSNPDSANISFTWSADENNPSNSVLQNPNDSITIINFEGDIKEGEYYFNLVTVAETGDTVKARTFVTVKNGQVIPFNIYNDYASWIDSAIIYEITPYNFVNPKGNFKQVKKKIPDFVRLGVNTLWIQPVYKTNYGGQGYDVIDYFSIREDYGTEEELKDLIKEAKANGLRVLFDFVANHSSIAHPYAKHASKYGEESHYWNFYQRESDNTPYSQHYSYYKGFINYFWDQLPNLNFNNPEVERWISEAIRFWVEEYDIDGYRFDAVWGLNARKPQFMKDVRFALKRFKPEILMLAEDKATWEETFDKNFDVAFDWAPEESWVSHWSWQTNYSENGNQTIFNYSSENARQNLLRKALTNNGNGYPENAKILRFIGNNDIPHFITHHGLERTKMVATLLFSVPGVPMIYNGQEIGVKGHPYSTEYLFLPGYSIDYSDPDNLFPFYQRLIEIRKKYGALNSNNYQELTTDNDNYTFAFRRWSDDQNLFTTMNMRSSSANFNVTIPIDELQLDTANTYYMTDLISGEVISGTLNELENIHISIPKFSSKIFLLADSIEVVTNISENNLAVNIPSEFSLSQNYPNPFNPTTAIEYVLPDKGRIKIKIFDAIGREVKVLVDDVQSKGKYKILFESEGFASGIYFYSAQFKNNIITKKMVIIK